MTRRILALALLISAALAMTTALGCTEKIHPPTSPPGPTGPPLTPDSVQAIFDAHCIGCHSGPGPSGGMDLSADSSYAQIVNVRSTRCDPLDRVEPTDPDNSCIVLRIEGTVTPQMPFGGPALDPTDIAKIRNWIAQGAGAVSTGPALRASRE